MANGAKLRYVPSDVLRNEDAAYAFGHDALVRADYLLPNDEQILGFTGTTDLVEGCRQLLGLGVRCVAVTAGADGAVVVDEESVSHVPAFAVDVVDTTGCGDAFSAGFLRGLSIGRTPVDAAALGCAAAALVAGGLGSDYGTFDLATALEFTTSSANPLQTAKV